MVTSDIRWRIYPTLIDTFNSYLDSGEIYARYWGGSDNPPFTEEEFCARQYKELIDKLNRRPTPPSEPASRGTLFNVIIDAMISGTKPDPIYQVNRICDDDGNPVAVSGICDGFSFTYPLSVCREFAGYFKGALSQVFVKAVLPIFHGSVELYGYIDELMPLCCHDIKTTGSYSVGKFKHHAQHHAYLYCLDKTGCRVDGFEYDVAEFSKSGNVTGVYKEYYQYYPEYTENWLIECCCALIEFIKEHRSEIHNDRLIIPYK